MQACATPLSAPEDTFGGKRMFKDYFVQEGPERALELALEAEGGGSMATHRKNGLVDGRRYREVALMKRNTTAWTRHE
ncbi:MAG: hypothetical protein C4318_08895 [Acidimicrobiia bacterium]